MKLTNKQHLISAIGALIVFAFAAVATTYAQRPDPCQKHLESALANVKKSQGMDAVDTFRWKGHAIPASGDRLIAVDDIAAYLACEAKGRSSR